MFLIIIFKYMSAHRAFGHQRIQEPGCSREAASLGGFESPMTPAGDPAILLLWESPVSLNPRPTRSTEKVWNLRKTKGLPPNHTASRLVIQEQKWDRLTALPALSTVPRAQQHRSFSPKRGGGPDWWKLRSQPHVDSPVSGRLGCKHLLGQGATTWKKTHSVCEQELEWGSAILPLLDLSFLMVERKEAGSGVRWGMQPPFRESHWTSLITGFFIYKMEIVI